MVSWRKQQRLPLAELRIRSRQRPLAKWRPDTSKAAAEAVAEDGWTSLKEDGSGCPTTTLLCTAHTLMIEVEVETEAVYQIKFF
jgi:hypothetical protein